MDSYSSDQYFDPTDDRAESRPLFGANEDGQSCKLTHLETSTATADGAIRLRKYITSAIVIAVVVGACFGAVSWNIGDRNVVSSSTQARSSSSSISQHNAEQSIENTPNTERPIENMPNLRDYLSPKSKANGDVRRAERKPNFVFILIDDMPWNAMANGVSDMGFVTPNIRQFVEEKGVILSNYYAQEMCTPSRSSLMTGRYPTTIGMQYGELSPTVAGGVNLTEILLPQVLESAGYRNYMLGKWNIGGSSPEYLPTSRGFHHFLGYIGGSIYPWSKRSSVINQRVIDFMYSDRECYNKYDLSDNDVYETFVFESRALDVISSHDFEAGPMFLYLAYHAVHNPLTEDDFSLDAAEVGEDMYSEIEGSISVSSRQRIAMALAVIDRSVYNIYNAVASAGQEDNTYFIIASDNGGCSFEGGMNAPLRGDKGTLYEGGAHVNGMIFGNIVPSSARGSSYPGLMHVSDWLPTMVGLAGFDYLPPPGHALDGIDQSAALFSNTADSPLSAALASLAAAGTADPVTADTLEQSLKSFPRTEMLYNAYVKVGDTDASLTGTSAAFRDVRYKLLYTFADDRDTTWFQQNVDYTNYPGAETSLYCVQQGRSFFPLSEVVLYDLLLDPFETTNIIAQPEYAAIKDKLTAQLEYLASIAKPMSGSTSDVGGVVEFFVSHDDFVQPFQIDMVEVNLNLPQRCSKSTVLHRGSNK